MMIYKYSGVISSDLEKIQCCVDEIIKELDDIVNNSDIIFDLRLILNELVINSAIHGNELEESRFIKLDVFLDEDKFEIFVEDEGEGIEYDFNSYDPFKLECCGRGLIIVNSLSDELFIDKNKIRVVKMLNG